MALTPTGPGEGADIGRGTVIITHSPARQFARSARGGCPGTCIREARALADGSGSRRLAVRPDHRLCAGRCSPERLESGRRLRPGRCTGACLSPQASWQPLALQPGRRQSRRGNCSPCPRQSPSGSAAGELDGAEVQQGRGPELWGPGSCLMLRERIQGRDKQHTGSASVLKRKHAGEQGAGSSEGGAAPSAPRFFWGAGRGDVGLAMQVMS